MKKVLSFVLILSLILGLSVYAFAAGSPVSEPAAERDVFVPLAKSSEEDDDLLGVKVTEDVSIADEAVAVAPLSEAPEAVQEEARAILTDLSVEGYKIVSAFAVYSDDSSITTSVVELNPELVNEDYEIFDSTRKIKPELKDGKLVFEEELPAVIVVTSK